MYSKVCLIPKGPLQDIVERIIENKAPNPGNFPTTRDIKNEWFIWKKDNPHQVITYEKTECKFCYSTGFLWFKAVSKITELEAEHVCRCGSCENWKGEANPKVMSRFTRAYLEGKGLKLFPYWKHVDPDRYKNVKEAVSSIGQPIPKTPKKYEGPRP